MKTHANQEQTNVEEVVLYPVAGPVTLEEAKGLLAQAELIETHWGWATATFEWKLLGRKIAWGQATQFDSFNGLILLSDEKHPEKTVFSSENLAILFDFHAKYSLAIVP